MKAVNLIPVEDRKGGGAGAAGRSGGAVYVLLGALALFVVLTGAYVMAGKSVTDKQNELAVVERDAQAAQAQADKLSAYTRFADLRAKRVQTVSQLASSRFDWSHALREVARVIPENAWLTDLVATASPDVQVEGGSGGAGSLRGAMPVPAIQVTGCTTSQASVAKMLARMKLIDGVQRVSLATSEKNDSVTGDAAGAQTGGGDASNGGDCRNGSSHFPKFELVVFFEGTAAPAAAPATPGATSAAQTTTTPATGTATTPAAGTSTTATTPSTATPAAGTSTTPSSSPQPASGGTTP